MIKNKPGLASQQSLYIAHSTDNITKFNLNFWSFFVFGGNYVIRIKPGLARRQPLCLARGADNSSKIF